MTDLVPFQQLERMAQVMGRSKMFGKSSEELLPLMLIAQAEGKHPAIAAQEYDIIQGRPALNSKSALARFQAAGGSIKWIERSDAKAAAQFSHPQGGEVVIEWPITRAEKAGLTGKDNWKKYPAQMLSARVVAEGVRACFPACLSGMYTTEEVQDFDLPAQAPERNVTPPREEEPAPEEPREETDREACIRLADALGKDETWLKKLKAMHGGDYRATREDAERQLAAKTEKAAE